MNYFFTTTSRSDYNKKELKKTESKRIPQEFPDPLNEGYRNFLILQKDNVPESHENVDEYMNQFIGSENRKKITKFYFPVKSIDKKVIEKHLACEKSSYTRDYYNKFENYTDVDIRKLHVELPENVKILQTTQRAHYRNPETLASDAFKNPTQMIRPQNHLENNENIREIGKEIVDETEYADAIGKFGGLAIRKQIHGKFRKF